MPCATGSDYLEQSKKKKGEEQKKELYYSTCYTDSGTLTRRRCNHISTMNILKSWDSMVFHPYSSWYWALSQAFKLSKVQDQICDEPAFSFYVLGWENSLKMICFIVSF